MQELRISGTKIISFSHFLHSYKSFESENDTLAYNEIADTMLNITTGNADSISE